MFIFMRLKQYSAWPEPHSESVGYRQEEDERPTNPDEWKVAQVTPQQSREPNATEAAAHAKEAQTSTECVGLNILFKSWTFSA